MTQVGKAVCFRTVDLQLESRCLQCFEPYNVFQGLERGQLSNGHLKNSLTRFVKIMPLVQNFKSVCLFFEVLLIILKNSERILSINSVNFHFCKWANIENIIQSSGHTVDNKSIVHILRQKVVRSVDSAPMHMVHDFLPLFGQIHFKIDWETAK